MCHTWTMQSSPPVTRIWPLFGPMLVQRTAFSCAMKSATLRAGCATTAMPAPVCR